MASKVIPDERVQRLNDRDPGDGAYLLYWMQQSQRAEWNHALEFAVQRANKVGTRLLVCFGLTEDYPDANLRHFHFMLQGLQETQAALKRRNIPLVVRQGDPAEIAISLGKRATEIICDRGYLRHQRRWREQVAKSASCRVWQVETDAIVPVESASQDPEYAARTIRPKLHRVADRFLKPLATTAIEKHSLNLGVSGLNLDHIEDILSKLSINRDVSPVSDFVGGTSPAKQRLEHFLSDSLSKYDERGDLACPNVSRLSPYLHFGQISPLAIASTIKRSRGHAKRQKEAFLEELLVRRELGVNFVYFNNGYDSLACIPEWAQESLQAHQDDEREHQYTVTELENAQTHDPAWNAAMLEMKRSGYLHNYLRMYWGKKIIEWTNTTNYAYRVAIDLNNRYFLDGRDPNSYANVAWLFGLHDRPHPERDVFGKVRYMSAGGLRRKFDVDRYIRTVAERFGTQIKGFEVNDGG
ncbi:MAG: deoxyribodipyrimidine photolyase [Planctomycetota bacterium]|nr:MAG: deoxyribodipyrimidine photolyase [Planctomycetota bacterium]